MVLKNRERSPDGRNGDIRCGIPHRMSSNKRPSTSQLDLCLDSAFLGVHVRLWGLKEYVLERLGTSQVELDEAIEVTSGDLISCCVGDFGKI